MAAVLCSRVCIHVHFVYVGLTNINGSAYFVYFWSLEDNLTENEWDHASDINNHHYIWNIIWHPILKMFIITVKAKGGTKRDRFFLNWDISKSLKLTMSFQKSIWEIIKERLIMELVITSTHGLEQHTGIISK